MSSFSRLFSLVAIASLASGTLAVQCGGSQHSTTADVRALRDDLSINGENYFVSGRALSKFDQVRTAALTMRRVSGLVGGSTHVFATQVGDIVQNIIDDCCSGPFCCGNDNVKGNQGDTINVNIPC